MPFVMPEIVLQKVIDHGIKKLRENKVEFNDLFSQFTQEELDVDYGEKYLEQIWEWFTTTKIPIVKAWSFNRQNVPSISVHLANETEDETKASMQDIGDISPLGEVGTGVFTVMVDIGIHANKAGDHVLWLYYIVSYVLFRHKSMAERFGLMLHTFSASDYNKDVNKMTENIWTRWIRYRCTTQNFWVADQYLDIEEINTELTEYNLGIRAGRTGDEDGDEEVLI
jgi:hypothetical protein